MTVELTDPEFLMKIPKVELHLHLEGAMSLQTLFDLIQKKGDPSIKTTDDLKKALIYTDFPHFIDTWIWKNTFITEERDFEEITYQVLQTLSHHHVFYAEVFYSPSDFEEQGLSAAGITECIIKGKKRAYHEFGIRSAFILDIVRGCTPEVGMQRLEEITPYLGEVIGIGLGGSEQKYPPDPYAPVYREAKDRGSD